MAGPPLPFTPLGDPAIDARARELVEALRGPIGCPLLYGRLVTVDLPVGDVTFNHLLSRQPVGMFPVDNTGAAAGYFRTDWNNRTITLTSAVACTVTFWVF